MNVSSPLTASAKFIYSSIAEPQTVTNIPLSFQNKYKFYHRTCTIKFNNQKPTIVCTKRSYSGKYAEKMVAAINDFLNKKYTVYH